MLEALISEFTSIEDPRCAWRVEHKLLDILVIAVCAVLGEAVGLTHEIASVALPTRQRRPTVWKRALP